MAHTARCPSCGATVEFKSVASVLAVCDYCQSTLVRNGEEIENLGKMAELIEDRSLLQRGAEGSWQGVHFGLIGRIQLRYEQGLWNEWHLLFDNGKSGWLSEAGGEYVMSVPLRVTDPLPAFSDLAIGQKHTLVGNTFSVTNILTAECVAGEGELPFTVGAGYPAPVADLRSDSGGFATFDYSEGEDRPLVFVGDSVDFKSLGWANLRENIPIPAINVKARAFNCPSCAAPLTVGHDKIESVGCASCGAVLDTSHETVALLSKAVAAVRQPRLPLGSKGTLRDEKIEVIGFMQRCMKSEGVEYCWGEYVCLGRDNALLWLTEYEGHWNIARVANRAVRAIGDVTYEGENFRHFQGYTAYVKYVIGEFPWRVRIDEVATVDDYVAPPRMVSRERTNNEETWTVADYVQPEEIATAFGLKSALPDPKGVFANQSNPHLERHRSLCRRFWQFAGLALAVHVLILMLGPSGTLHQQNVAFSPVVSNTALQQYGPGAAAGTTPATTQDDTLVSAEFKVPGDTPRIEVVNDTTANNNWVALGLTLVNKDTGQAWQASREVSRYSGVDGGESWSEGSASDEFYFGDVPAGTYLLAVEHEMDPRAQPVYGTLKVNRPGPRLSSLVLLLLALAAFPLFTRAQLTGFEKRRWDESDHPIVSSSDDDDD